jgi:hypothetical protein
MPAVMNTMCAPCSASAMRSRSADRQFARLLRLAAGAQARAELQLDMGIALFQRLRVGVAADEFDAADAFADHVIHRVAARTADPHHLDHGRVAVTFR